MIVVRRIARPMLAAAFVVGGLDSLRHPGPRAEMAAPLVNRLAKPLRLPDDPELMVRANGATMLAAGTLLGLGRMPRVAAFVLAGSLVPTTYAGHAFWAEHDPAKRAQQRTQFLKNAGLVGGLLLASVDTAGKPGLPWRARHLATDARRGVAHTRGQAKHVARAARRDAKHAAATARREARLAVSQAHDKLT